MYKVKMLPNLHLKGWPFFLTYCSLFPSTYYKKMHLLKEHHRCQVEQGISSYIWMPFQVYTHSSRERSIKQKWRVASIWEIASGVRKRFAKMLTCYMHSFSRTACKMFLTKPMYLLTLIAKEENKNWMYISACCLCSAIQQLFKLQFLTIVQCMLINRGMVWFSFTVCNKVSTAYYRFTVIMKQARFDLKNSNPPNSNRRWE